MAPTENSDDGKIPASVAAVILPRTNDIGGFEVRRALPTSDNRLVGPFIFWDQMGPGEFLAGRGLDVRPHPHIGLATVTYLFAGEILHRDTLGSAQPIRPGDVNWMTAGRGIAHSERTDPRPDRIEQAKADWRAGRFGRVPGDDVEFIPLP